MHWLLTFGLAIILFAGPLCLARDLAIVVDKSNAASGLTAAELEKALKTGAQKWPDGRRIRVYLTDPASAGTKMILQRVFKMKAEEITSFLDAHKTDIQMAGSDEVVLTLVANNPGALGIVDVYSINSQIRVLRVDEKLPLEPGYLLHGN